MTFCLCRKTYGGEVQLILVFEVYVISIGDSVAAASGIITLHFGKDSCITDGQRSQEQ